MENTRKAGCAFGAEEGKWKMAKLDHIPLTIFHDFAYIIQNCF